MRARWSAQRGSVVKRLEGRVAVVTGAGSGIGRATCQKLANAGCDVAAVDLNLESAEETAHLIRHAGRVASAHQADVSDKARMASLPAEILGVHGQIHVLVNNAGVTAVYRFEEHSLEDFEWVLGIDFWGVVYGCKFFIPHLAKQDEAHIVNISSMAGLLGLPMQSSYCAAKFAVRGFSESLIAELAPTNIGVSVVFPGPYRTKVMRSARNASGGTVGQLADLLERHARPPEEVAQRILTAIKRKQSHVVVGPQAYLTDWLSRASPSVAGVILGWGFDKASARIT